LIIFLIFLVDLMKKGRIQFETVQVYTIITYINLIISPLNTLPSAIIGGVQALASCRRIDHLLQTEDIKQLETYHLEKGGIAINNLNGRWESEKSN
jgi:hypothetical protein